MKTLHRLPLMIAFFVTGISTVAHSAVPAHLWSQRFGDASTQFAYSVATDAAENIIVVGAFSGTVNFGGSPLTSAGLADVFVAKFSAAGVHQWSQRYGDASNQTARDVAIDASGGIVITGSFLGTLNFGGGNLTALGGDDIFLVKFSSAGVHSWSKRFGDGGTQSPSGIATDPANNVIITGTFDGVVNFGGANLIGAGAYDIFVAKFNSAGTHQWSQRFGDAAWQYGISVAAGGSGNVVLTGIMEGTVNFGGGSQTSAGGWDIYLTKLNSAGVHQWSQVFGDTALFQAGRSLVLDAAENVILAGEFDGTVNFGGSDLTTVAILEDVYLAKFNSSGVHQWSQQFGDAVGQGVYQVAVDASGNIALTGQFRGTINFGGEDLTSGSTGNMYLANFNSAGAHRWSQRYGGSFIVNPASIAYNTGGNLIAAGWFEGWIDFGGATVSSAGSNDIFLVTFGGLPAEPEIIDIVDVGNDQGRRVRIQFAPSGGDDPTAVKPIAAYEAYRRIDPLPLAAVGADDRATLEVATDSPALLPPGDWEFAASIPAHAEDEYFMVTPTLADSTLTSGQHYSVFFIRAATGTPSLFYDSLPDSGYSLDNLAPGIPGGFAYNAGQLTWDESTAQDFDYFSVYGSNTNSFASATLIDYTVAPEMDVTASPYTYYFATATDFSGNEGKPAATSAVSDVGGTPKGYVLSISSYPNPFNPETTIRYTVPSKGRVEISVFDLRGAHVATLVDEEKDSGAYTHAWDGRDTGGNAASSGVYFARMRHPSGTRSYKMVLLK